MNFQEARKKLPQFNNLPDDSFVDVVHRVYYPNMDKADLASRLGYKAPEAPIEPRSTMRAMGDLATQFGTGVVGDVRMMSDIFGADNRVSQGLRSAEDALGGLLSAQAVWDQQKIAEIMKEAEGKGWGDQVVAGLKAAGVAPGAMMAQALGTSIPTLATAMIPGAGPAAVATRLGAAGAMGAAQGAGNIKGVIYEDVKKELSKDPSLTPEQIEARAVEAQSFAGPNSGQIALGGALGVAAGATGMEKVVSGLRNGVTKAPAGIMGRVLSGGVAEAVPEFGQGGQEKYASNTALNNEGFRVDPMSGVIAQGTMEAAAGFGAGALTGIPKPRQMDPATQAADLLTANLVPETGPLGRAANAGTVARANTLAQTGVDPMQPAAQDAVDDPIVDRINQIPNEAERVQAAKAYAVLGKQGVAKGIVQANQKMFDRLMAKHGLSLDGEEDGAANTVRPMDSMAAGDGALDPMAGMGAAPGVVGDAGVAVEQPGVGAPEPDMRPVPLEPGAGAELTTAQPVADLVPDAGNMVGDQVEQPLNMVPQGVDPATGEVLPPAAAPEPLDFTGKTDDELQQARKAAQSPTIRKALATEIQARKAAAAPAAKTAAPNVTLKNEGKTAPAAVTPETGKPAEAAPVQAPAVTAESTAPVTKTATKKDANAIFGGKALTDRKNAVPPNGKALDEFASSGKQAEFDALLKMRRADKSSLTEDQENRFFDLRTERNQAVAAVENAALGRVGQKPVTHPATSGVPEAGAGVTQPPQAAPELVKVASAQGGSVHLKKSDLDSDKTFLPMFTADGKRKGRSIHRDNLDPAGEKLAKANAEKANNPLFDVITRKKGGAFATKMAAQRELNVRGMAESHEVMPVEGGKGFIGRKKQEVAPQDDKADMPKNTEKSNTSGERVDEAPKSEQVSARTEADRWQELPVSKREELAQKIGRKGAFATKLAENQWDKLIPSIQAQLREAMGPKEVKPEAESKEPKDEAEANEFVNAPDGGLDFGEITPEIGKAMRRQPGKIRLQKGDSSFGLAHIEARHGDEIRAAGFSSIEDFVSGAVDDIEAVWRPAATSQLVVIQATERGKVVFIQLQAGKDDAGDFYAVNTAFPASRAYAQKRKGWEKLWSRVPVPASDVGASDPSAELGNKADSKDAMVSSQSAASVSAKPDSGKPAKIEDSGEVLEGARKLYAKSYAAKLDEGKGMDLAAVPLSKSWPEPDYQRLIDEGADPWAVALARAVRDEVPTKPMKGWKLKGWVQKVEGLRDMAAQAMSGDITKDKFVAEAGKVKLDTWLNKIDLYEAVGHANSLKTLRFSEGEYGMYGGQVFKPAKKLWTINMPSTSASATWSNGNWGNDLVAADTKAEAIEKLKAWAAEQEGKEQAKPAGKRTEFDVYSYRNNPKVFIVGKRISATKSIDLMEFESNKEANAFIVANQAELEKMLADAKVEQPERREENTPRVGDDHRNGADVTTEQFREAFGFRGEQFGASMPQSERQANMNQAYDALMDLAGMIGIPPKALSLNGELGLAFGARGRGGKNPAMAHYEPDTTGAVTPNRVVINLTRKNGAGSLAHEWFHAVDNHFARMRGEKAGMLTESYPAKREGVRPEMVDAFKKVMMAIQLTGVRERSKNMDKKRTKDYWSTGLEMAARSFESYIIAKLQDKSGSNDYLANIVPESLWLQQESYPYPTMGELPAIRTAFDNFFATVQTKETDKGVAMFSRRPATQQAYEERIDALFSGEKADRKGAVLLDSSDIMGLLNYVKAPMVLNEKHLIDGLINHPEMTAKQWKRVPGWLENPAAVYTDPKHPGRLTVIAPELVAGYPVVMAVEPNPESPPQGHKGPVQLLVTAFAKTTGGLPPIGVLAASGRLLFADTKMAPIAWRNIGENPRAFNPSVGAKKILTEKNLAGYRKAQDPAMSLGAGRGIEVETAQGVVDGITSRWTNAPEIVVVTDLQDAKVPERVRLYDAEQRSQGASGEPEGFWYEGKAYIMAAAINTPQDVARVLFHETLGHYGLRGTFGDSLTPILKQLAALRRTEVAAKAKQYGLDMSIEADRLTAAEEVLAEMAQSQPNIGFVKRAIAAIRAFLRKNVPGFQNMKLTDADIIANYLIPARAFVERRPGGRPKSGLSFSRTQDQGKVVDANLKTVDVGDAVDGLIVRNGVPDFGSIDASLTDYKILSGIREVPFSIFSGPDPETTRTRKLAAGIEESGEIAPLIVVFDKDGPYILEGAHRFDALQHLGKTSFPAKVVIDKPKDQSSPVSGGAMFSRSMGATELTGQVRDKLNETFNHPGKLNWWHKTVGSQYNLAERNPAFKKVFDAAQSFINDVSYYGTEAANMAPKILPKLETLKDLTKTAISAADNKAVAAPVFEGTLSWTRDPDGKPVRIEDGDTKTRPGVRWTDAELKSIFNLTDDQVGLYKEFRAATDTSLDNMAKAQMLREAGKDVADMRDKVMEAPDVDTAAQMLRDLLLDLANDNPDRADVLTDAAAGVLDTAAKINELKEQGYAPLSRFGRFTVDVVVDGKREYFGLFETEADSNKMAAKMRMSFGRDNVAQGTMSQKEFELFQGITPESLELFGNMMGLDSTGNEEQDKAFQAYLKLTKNNRSAMKRLIHRQGIAGYSEDVGRVLAAFVYANARQTSAALHIGQMDEAITEIQKGEGELKDHALELAKYIKEPREEAAALRGLLFAQYLGGSVASAMVNFTQPLTVSIPYLSQFGGLAKAGKAWAQAVKDMRHGVQLEAGLERALKDAEESGVVSPQEVHQLMAQARGAATLQSGDGTKLGDAKAMAANGWTRTALAWGKLFGYAEQVNRRSTFIAAYRLAVDQKIQNPGKFAEKAVNETQFVNNKANKMKFGRGAIGATLMTFKSYSINWLELMHRLSTQDGKEGKLAAAYMLGALFLVAGAGGLPFAEDAEDLIDALGQKMGYNFSLKKKKQEFLEDLFGKAGAQFVDRGLTGLPGVPIDVSGRMGMANLIPGTGLMLEKKDHTRDVMELAGPAGEMTQRFFQAIGSFLSGDVGTAIEQAAPKAIGNMIKGGDMLDKGMYRDTKGAKVIDTTAGEALAKMIGFQPASVSQVQESNYINQRAKDFYNLKSQEIRAMWAMGIFENDPDKVKEARQMVDDWNQDNPDQKMTVNMPAIIKKVREMRKDKAQRIADTAPKAMRAQMRADARELANQ